MKPIPTINVNLRPCDCGVVHLTGQGTAVRRVGNGPHLNSCAATPIPIPCLIPPSITFTVRLGECDDKHCLTGYVWGAPTSYGVGCPARPIRIACAIGSSDGTWASSFVADAYIEEEGGKRARDAALDEVTAAKDRWALVTALVTGTHLTDLDPQTRRVGMFELFAQRDAVFAALADMARAGVMIVKSWEAIPSDIRTPMPLLADHDDGARESQVQLERYVARLIEQVGILEGGE